ncbi:hypothetical protein AEAC466_19240 [Asticcacaulis sp. AC466]|uniref:hypothetical protein n=1 Tax=Asticcacaulis sp. AC466 TaxID=1282362 RepID=UPI0003C40BD6|nr:hypothetical protein [Asticcacaulis sp. AC466]ESQ82055.1 hypothetical protein AEAC466_19240 [Asticcacaulis sp. AC466]
MTDVPVWVPVVAALSSGIGGIFLGRFSMSKKERADVSQKNYENAVAATAPVDDAYKSYVAALSTYSKSQDPSFDEFLALASSGDSYFTQVGKMCDAIIADKVDPNIRDATWLPKIKVTFERVLPAHYDALVTQAKKKGYRYTGKLRRSDHESVYTVAEKYSTTSAWLRPHEDD